jgi:hypothetical protein
MRDPDKCSFEYCGYKSPETPDELDMEVLGLHNLIKSAEARISSLVQSKFYAEAVMREAVETKSGNDSDGDTGGSDE